MKAVIYLDVHEWQIGQDVTVYFPDTMLKHGKCERLNEQDAVVPYIDIDEAKCPICKVRLTRQELIGDDVLFEDFFDYCPHCGKAVSRNV